jgi:hypothetical protein
MPENDAPQTPATDLAGYSSVDELARGYRNSGNEAKRLAAENQRLQEQLQGYAANQRQDIPNRSRPEDRLAEFGIPVDAMEEFFTQRFGRALEPLANMANARNQVMSEYPDYVTFEQSVNEWVRSDPARSQDYDKRFAADPSGAMQLAFLKFGEAKRKTVQPPAPNAQEMVDASLPGGRAGDSRRTEQSGHAEIEEAYRKYQASGSQKDAEAFAKLRIRQSIPGSFYEGMG